jgi:hypothetical protein
MTPDQIKALPTLALIAIVRSTDPTGKLWHEYMIAHDELARRRA